ncbi:MAG: phage major capsid protein, partial [Oscillospiraceae bacterium]|nr:phage major capsid protein [Oscillospiraceae bacterium]
MSGVQTNRSAITLPSEISSEILQKMQEGSAVMRLARQITLPGNGKTIPVITSDPQASWVSETAAKPVSNPGLSSKLMSAYKLAVIVPFSKEFRRDLAALYDALIAHLPAVLANKFDATVIGAVDKPGENFDNFALCTAQSLIASGGHTAYDGLVAAVTDVAEQNASLDGFAISPAAKGILLGAKDGDGRPLFINSVAQGAIPMILGCPTYENRGLYKAGAAPVDSGSGTPAIVGVGGDWTQAVWGTVEGMEISFSDQATLV